MTSEMIYEGLGEVVAVENKPIAKTGADLTNGDSSTLQFFSQEMSDEAVAESIFNSCDTEQTGMVNVTILVDFLLKSCGGENEENKGIFHNLLALLDPQQVDPQITSQAFQIGLNSWIAQLLSDTEDPDVVLTTLRFSKIESEQSDSGNSLCTSQPSSEALGELPVDELQYQHIKLQESHKNLHAQLADIDEINLRLQTENSNLKTKILSIESELKEKNEELQHLQNDNSFLHNGLQDQQSDFKQLMARYQTCEKEAALQNNEIVALQCLVNGERDNVKRLEVQLEHLEQMIRTKETELADKDKQVHTLTLQLNQRQSSLDQSLAFAEQRLSLAPAGFETPSLASELHCSSPCALSWKKPKDTGRIGKQKAILPWDAMFDEPEFEDELSNETVSFSRGQSPTLGSCVQVLQETTADLNESPITSPTTTSGSGSTRSMFCEHLISTPKTRRPASVNMNLTGADSTTCLKENLLSVSQEVLVTRKSTYRDVVKNLSFTIFNLFVILFAATMMLIWGLLMLSMIDAGNCSAHGTFPNHCSPWSKLYDFLKPYCHVEFSGHPPV